VRDHRHRHARALFRPARDHAQKKTGHAVEQGRADVLSQRDAWLEGQPALYSPQECANYFAACGYDAG
jgi:hypothetical protein